MYLCQGRQRSSQIPFEYMIIGRCYPAAPHGSATYAAADVTLRYAQRTARAPILKKIRMTGEKIEMDIDKLLAIDGSNATLSVNEASINKELNSSKKNEGATTRATSLDVACTEITLPQSSAAHTPPTTHDDTNECNEVLSTPQPPTAQMRFDTLEEAERHYKMNARRRGFGTRDIPHEDQEFIKVLHSVNMETNRMMQIMATLYESLEGVPYTSKDMANFRATLRAENRYTNMQDTMAYFKALKSQDKDFYYRFELDDEDRVANLFWLDGASRRAYKYYNDCVSVDTTYMTNTYKMPFAPFIGINSHGQSIQFGCGFLRNELGTSFDWLFETFLIAMDGLAPLNIITDQDFAMRSRIDNKFPNARHRNCRWHIIGKATEEIGPIVVDPQNEKYKCGCCKFERDGIMCCHILKAMVQLGVTEMPSAYVLRRWTWSAEENLVKEIPGQPAAMPEESRKCG
uniref:Uncharacterized protein n=1 Tax=Avena sativa TaxID=4498 RepID=A0ACD5WQN3_AVESA